MTVAGGTLARMTPVIPRPAICPRVASQPGDGAQGWR